MSVIANTTPHRHGVSARARSLVVESVAPKEWRQQPTPALTFLCLWFASQLFFNEKTTFLTFSWIAHVRPDRVLFIFLASYVLLRGHRQLKRLRIIKEEVLMLCFFAVLLMSCLYAGVRPLNYHLSTVFTFIGFPMFAFWLCRRIPFTRSNLTRLLFVFVAIGGYLGLCGLCERYGWRLFIFPGYIFDPSVGIHVGRSRGPFVQASTFGGVLCLFAVMTGWFINHVTAKKNVGATVVTMMLLGLMTVSIYLSNTRAVWVNFAVTVVILAIARNGLRRYTYVIALLLLTIFVSGVFANFSLHQATLFSRRDEAAQARMVLAHASIAMIKERPLLGSGYGTFALGNNVSLDQDQMRMVEGEGNHNTFLGLAVEVGVLGLVPYVLILGGFLLRGARLWRMSKNQSVPARDFALAAIAALLGYLCLIQFSDVRFFSFFNSALFAIFGVVFAWEAEMQDFLRRFPNDSEEPWARQAVPAQAHQRVDGGLHYRLRYGRSTNPRTHNRL